MTTSYTMLLIILGCALVTWVPRVIPFLVVRNIALPEIVLKWLSYIPVCILSALILDSLFHFNGTFVTVNWNNLIALVPTLLIAILTKSLAKTVVVGVVTMFVILNFL